MFGKRRQLEHEARINDLKQGYEAHIADLKAQMSDLRKLAFNATSATRIPLVALEADAVLSSQDQVMEVDPDELARLEEEMHEADRVLAGTY